MFSVLKAAVMRTAVESTLTSPRKVLILTLTDCGKRHSRKLHSVEQAWHKLTSPIGAASMEPLPVGLVRYITHRHNTSHYVTASQKIEDTNSGPDRTQTRTVTCREPTTFEFQRSLLRGSLCGPGKKSLKLSCPATTNVCSASWFAR